MLKKLLIGLLAMVAIVVSIGARQGSTFTVARSIDIRAAPATVAPLLANVRPPTPMARIKAESATTQSGFTMLAVGPVTRVTWRVHGPLTIRTRLITSFIGMDVLLGAELEKGLAGVKAVAETPHQK
jgi:hypothetical protein